MSDRNKDYSESHEGLLHRANIEKLCTAVAAAVPIDSKIVWFYCDGYTADPAIYDHPYAMAMRYHTLMKFLRLVRVFYAKVWNAFSYQLLLKHKELL